MTTQQNSLQAAALNMNGLAMEAARCAQHALQAGVQMAFAADEPRWPIVATGYRWDVRLLADDRLLIVLRTRVGAMPSGPFRVQPAGELADLAHVPGKLVSTRRFHEALRAGLKLREQDAVFVVPLFAAGRWNDLWAHWTEHWRDGIASQVGLNLAHQAAAIGVASCEQPTPDETAPPRVFVGRQITHGEAARRLGYKSRQSGDIAAGGTLLMAIKRAPQGAPLAILRDKTGRKAKTKSGRLREDAVEYVALLLGVRSGAEAPLDRQRPTNAHKRAQTSAQRAQA